MITSNQLDEPTLYCPVGMSTGKFEGMWKILFETSMYVLAAALILLPVGLSLFTIFLMLTYPATEEEIIEYGHWVTDEELDQLRKNR